MIPFPPTEKPVVGPTRSGGLKARVGGDIGIHGSMTLAQSSSPRDSSTSCSWRSVRSWIPWADGCSRASATRASWNCRVPPPRQAVPSGSPTASLESLQPQASFMA
jgi:hypothetical protein